MYHVFYLYRVPSQHLDRFLMVVRDASALYRQHGAMNSVTLRVTDATAKFGCAALSDVVSSSGDEALYLGIDSFRDLQQYHSTMAQVDAHPQIGQLFQDFQQVVDLGRVIRWETEDAA